MASIFVKQSLVFCTNIIFPPTCFGCGSKVQKHGDICQICYRDIHFIQEPYCPVYGMGLGLINGVAKTTLSIEALMHPPPFRRARAVFQHRDLASRLISRLKYGDREDLAPIFAYHMLKKWPQLIKDCDIIVPIALHYKRFLSRRYNQAALLAKHLAKLAQKPYNPNILKRLKNTKPQASLRSKAREQNVKSAFTCSEKYKPIIQNKTVLLIDDVYTTGATVKAASKILLRAGAKHVDVLTLSNAHKYVL
ncbi:ComF family protein [Bartonella sp. TP]|uniref:ComF family protein n=1 Tax=Bartonella sp. TP TaxID=3057550 RepID=UPI0025B05AA8|nr:ComF family protein [Bartonella sp. TP]WJW79629.1 ComF family protein [Bartonella sp. TP]